MTQKTPPALVRQTAVSNYFGFSLLLLVGLSVPT
jgi:hypothetical protein